VRGWWTCQRSTGGQKCRTLNPNRRQICERCGKRRPPKKEPPHRAVLKAMSYDNWIILNGGEHCGICGKVEEGRRLCRDHDHKTGQARGLLCWTDNYHLRGWVTIEWLKAAIEYLERAEQLPSAPASGYSGHVPDALEDS